MATIKRSEIWTPNSGVLKRRSRTDIGSGAPPVTIQTVYGACAITNDGDASTVANIQAKWGVKASSRLFYGNALTVPTISNDLLHVSSKPTSTLTDGQIDSWITSLTGHMLTFFHESDNDGLSTTARNARIALWNRLYDRNVALGRPCRISHVFVGTFWGSSTSDATRDLWMNTCKGDYIGLDYDGVHDLHTSAPPDGITYYANTGSQTSSSNKMTPESRIDNIQRYLVSKAANGWVGYTVPEFGTSIAPWDTDGAGRFQWIKMSTALFEETGAVAIHYYDDRVGSKDDVLYTGTPEKTWWQAKINTNLPWTGWAGRP